MRSYKAQAFTLVEVLVVVSIIAMLMGILMPSMTKAREHANRAVCMANLHSIGHSLSLYAHDNEDLLIPGDFRVSWIVWAQAQDGPGGGLKYRQVNLGHLLIPDILPRPTRNKHVLFCPSGEGPDGGLPIESFHKGWGSDDSEACISYMFNNALGGFDSYVQDGSRPVLSHRDRVNFLLGDGSVQAFDVKPLVFDAAAGPELLQDVAARYGVCFPTIMLHRWLERGQVDLAEARQYLGDPAGWFERNCTSSGLPGVLPMTAIGKRSIVCDVVGVWGGPSAAPVAPPPPG